MSHRSLVILLYFVQGLYGVYNQEVPDKDVVYVDEHTNVSLPCQGPENKVNHIRWSWSGRYRKNVMVQQNNSLYLSDVVKENNGMYECSFEMDQKIIRRVKVVVRGRPEPPQNVSVHAAQVIAIVNWNVHLDEDWESSPYGPKTTVHLHYRPISSEKWLQSPQRLTPQGQTTIYRLQPNTTYEIELWSSNEYGTSDVVKVNTTTSPDFDESEQERMMVLDVEEFNPVVWIIAVLVIVIVINILVGFLLFAYWRQRRINKSGDGDDFEVIELVPHIIENPAYQFSRQFDPAQEGFLSPSLSSHSAVALV